MKRKIIFFYFVYIICIITTIGCIVPTPVDVTLTQLSIESVKISWGDNSLVQGYLIERKDDQSQFKQIADIPFKLGMEKTYTDSNLITGIKYTYRIRGYFVGSFSDYSNDVQIILSENPLSESLIIDHTCTNLNTIPEQWVREAKTKLHIAYGHTSHGSQIVTGMTGLVSFRGNLFQFNTGGIGGALDLRDKPFSGANDLGSPNLQSWAISTRAYLNAHQEINVVIWSWCGQVSTASVADITTYLSLMTSLEIDYPQVRFVYMTGHLDGTGLTGNLHKRNEQIRAYCRSNNKVLYDFADIETYDSDGNYYGHRFPTDGCNYDYNNDGVTSQTGDPARPINGDRNWAVDWQNIHLEGVYWYNCPSAHTQPLNANMKAYAAWWLWARLAGWN